MTTELQAAAAEINGEHLAEDAKPLGFKFELKGHYLMRNGDIAKMYCYWKDKNAITGLRFNKDGFLYNALAYSWDIDTGRLINAKTDTPFDIVSEMENNK